MKLPASVISSYLFFYLKVEVGDSSWSTDIGASFLLRPSTHEHPTVSQHMRASIPSNAKALCAGIRKPPLLDVDVQTPINPISVTNSGEAVSDTGNDILIKPPSHFRPLTVTELSMNCSPAAADCVFGADVFPFTQRQLPPGIEKTV